MKSSGSYGEKLGYTLPNNEKTEAKYTTGQTGVQENSDAPPETKEQHTIEAPKVSTLHY
ncbi:hypothetical protein [Sporomusa malonica]|uniref:Uncharacterized protein n=1 Tax=Sporomusa malonica TaxID=112901 RepID=A0A1W1ZJY0_9FIRM|nr:hypothetical protein [Sporomusa malonica]SMC48809.1 hypothetical protein SAMN04488500_1049 [Sporomusa malonica]